jgi:hypothetical protein
MHRVYPVEIVAFDALELGMAVQYMLESLLIFLLDNRV